MNRAAFFGRTTPRTPSATTLNALAPYSGAWTYAQAAHLLRRTTFGPNHAAIKEAVDDGLDATLGKLFGPPPPLGTPPVYYGNFNADPSAGPGETWTDKPFAFIQNLQGVRERSLQAWLVGKALRGGTHLLEKMVLFWHNHWYTDDVVVNDARFQYDYILLLREFALGNFREFAKRMTLNPSMLRYLNGNENLRDAPNENYARELLELFTVGKGDLAGPGDYTTFTEDDVVAVARALTGWRDRGYLTQNADQDITVQFRLFQHDNGGKQLSHRFDNATISNEGDAEYATVIDLILGSPHCATFLARKLYRYFVYYELTPDVEATVIEPLAQLLRDHDYDIEPALLALLGSEHFFDMLNVGPMIKNPMDYTLGLLNAADVALPAANYNQEYITWFNLVQVLDPMQMRYFAAPNVAGWPAYYQEPVFYRSWISGVTLTLRSEFADTLARDGFTVLGQLIRIDVLALIAQFDNPTDPNALLADLNALFLPQPLDSVQLDYLKNILIPGLPDFEWTVEYGEYLNDPDDPALQAGVENKLRATLAALLTLPEFQLQ